MPKKHSKRYRQALELVQAGKAYTLSDAIALLKKFPKAKFNETVEMAFRLVSTWSRPLPGSALRTGIHKHAAPSSA